MDEIFDKILNTLTRWENGNLSSYDTYSTLKKELNKLNNSCTCEYDVCCQKHNEHSVPHKNCILR